MDPLIAHRDYVTRVIRLMICHVWKLSRRADPVPILRALDRNVDIMRKTTLHDGRHPAEGLSPPMPEWDALKSQLATHIEAHDDPDTSALEDACWSILEPYVTPTLTESPHDAHEYGCWIYDFRDGKPHTIDLHFRNGYRPQSPFRDRRDDLIAELLRLIDDVREERPTVTRIGCDSWLTSFEPFAALFPPEWNATLDLHGQYLATNGWWGQYMDERGAFNEPRAQRFRQTGDHPYQAGECECALDPVVKHLRSL